MIRILLILAFTGLCGHVIGQSDDSDLQIVRQRLDSISHFSAHLRLELDVSFINMPPKEAEIEYNKNKPLKFSGDDFLMIPRRGLDFSFSELFEYPYMTVPLASEIAGVRLMHIIPSDERSDIVMATLQIDTVRNRISTAKINTKKDGTYSLSFGYSGIHDILPSQVTVEFRIERIRIPLNFMGKDTEIDRETMKQEGDKEGRIRLFLSEYAIRRLN